VEHHLIGSLRRFIAPGAPETPELRWPIRFPGYPIPQEDKAHFCLHALAKVVALAPFLRPYGPISEAIVWDSSMRFSEGTFIRMMARIIQRVSANDLPTTGNKRKF